MTILSNGTKYLDNEHFQRIFFSFKFQLQAKHIAFRLFVVFFLDRLILRFFLVEFNFVSINPWS